MRVLIMFPGSLESSFVINEFDYIKEYFEKVYIIPFDNKKKICLDVVKKYGFEVINIEAAKRKVISLNFIKWLMKQEVKDEVRYITHKNGKKIKKFLYMSFYGIYAIESEKVIDEIIKNHLKDDICLYSFWLSRGAYSIAEYNKNTKNKIKKTISRAHGYDLYEERNELNYLPFRNFIKENINCISFISNNGLEYFVNKYGNATKNKQYVVNYLGTKNVTREKQIKKDKTVICIMSCSSVISVKRVDLIIDVLSRCKTPLRWLHIGDGDLRNQMEFTAKSEFYTSNNQYGFLGKIDNKKIIETYIQNDVDFFINLSDSEGIPVSIMEAMSIGIPVIARNVGGISEIVNNTCGLLLDEDEDINKMIHLIDTKIMERLNNVNEYIECSKKAYNVWNNKFNSEINYRKFFKE